MWLIISWIHISVNWEGTVTFIPSSHQISVDFRTHAWALRMEPLYNHFAKSEELHQAFSSHGASGDQQLCKNRNKIRDIFQMSGRTCSEHMFSNEYSVPETHRKDAQKCFGHMNRGYGQKIILELRLNKFYFWLIKYLSGIDVTSYYYCSYSCHKGWVLPIQYSVSVQNTNAIKNVDSEPYCKVHNFWKPSLPISTILPNKFNMAKNWVSGESENIY